MQEWPYAIFGFQASASPSQKKYPNFTPMLPFHSPQAPKEENCSDWIVKCCLEAHMLDAWSQLIVWFGEDARLWGVGTPDGVHDEDLAFGGSICL